MPQVTKPTIISMFLIAGLMFITACGSSSKNSKAPFDADTGHQANWLPAGHMTAAQEGTSVCKECHGIDYLGGVSGISCTGCHLGGPTVIHPTDWGQDILSKHGNYADALGTTSCANAACHGTALDGVTNSGPSCTSCHLGGVNSFHPVEWGQNIDLLHGAYVNTNGTAGCATAACHGAALGGVSGSGPACSSCHLDGASSVHPLDWGQYPQINHAAYVNANGATSCANAACHGTTLAGVSGSGPACTSCHLKGSPLTFTGCTSCHGNPPSGTAAPDRSGAHAAHNALPNVKSVCNTCHNGAGSTTIKHFDNTVELQFLSVYSAKSGTAVANADGTCSSVSCHGGQTTPAWLSGATIDLFTDQCASCHAFGTTEYNSYVSGQHDFHVNTEHFSCLKCHDPFKLAGNHFSTLNTTTMEGPASATILTDVNYNGATCNANCHPGTRSWF